MYKIFLHILYVLSLPNLMCTLFLRSIATLPATFQGHWSRWTAGQMSQYTHSHTFTYKAHTIRQVYVFMCLMVEPLPISTEDSLRTALRFHWISINVQITNIILLLGTHQQCQIQALTHTSDNTIASFLNLVDTILEVSCSVSRKYNWAV